MMPRKKSVSRIKSGGRITTGPKQLKREQTNDKAVMDRIRFAKDGQWAKKAYHEPTHLKDLSKDGVVLDFYTGKVKRVKGEIMGSKLLVGKPVYEDVELYLVENAKAAPEYRYRIEAYGTHGFASKTTKYFRGPQTARIEFDRVAREVWHDDIERLTKKGYQEGVNPEM